MFNSFFSFNIFKFKINFKTMRALYYEVFVSFCLSCHVTYAVSTYVVLAACRNKHVVKISEAYWTAILKYLLLFCITWKIISKMNIPFWDFSLNPHFISSSYFIWVMILFVLSFLLNFCISHYFSQKLWPYVMCPRSLVLLCSMLIYSIVRLSLNLDDINILLVNYDVALPSRILALRIVIWAIRRLCFISFAFPCLSIKWPTTAASWFYH